MYSGGTNVARQGTAKMSSTTTPPNSNYNYGASAAIDGRTSNIRKYARSNEEAGTQGSAKVTSPHTSNSLIVAPEQVPILKSTSVKSIMLNLSRYLTICKFKANYQTQPSPCAHLAMRLCTPTRSVMRHRYQLSTFPLALLNTASHSSVKT